MCYFCDKGHNVKGFLCASSCINGPLAPIYTSGLERDKVERVFFPEKIAA